MCLPLPTDFDLYLHAFIDVLSATLIINSKLQEISVLEFVRYAFRVGCTESYVVEERARTALRIPNEEFPTSLDPYLRMGSADDFALEGELIGAHCVRSCKSKP